MTQKIMQYTETVYNDVNFSRGLENKIRNFNMRGRTEGGETVAKLPKISLSPGPIKKYMSQEEPSKKASN